MRQLLLSLVAGSLCSAASATSLSLTGVGRPPQLTRGYTGPGDIITTNGVAWWGFRCYSSTYSGNVAVIHDGNGGANVTLSCPGSGSQTLQVSSGTLAGLKSDCASGSGFTC